MTKQCHLTLEERQIIEKGIRENSSKKAIADVIGKDASTIAKEIRTHRYQKIINSNFTHSDCIHVSECKGCSMPCTKYEMKPCSRRDRTPGACNGCEQKNRCRKTKFYYEAQRAQKEYEETLSDSRLGIRFSSKEFKEEIVNIVVPLLKQNQSPYHIVHSHPELGITEKTLYNYIEWGYLAPYGITNSSLRRKVKFKPKKA